MSSQCVTMLSVWIISTLFALASAEKVSLGSYSEGSLYVVDDMTIQWVQPQIPTGYKYRIFVDSKPARLLELAPSQHPKQKREYLKSIPFVSSAQSGGMLYAKSPERLDTTDVISIVDAKGKPVERFDISEDVNSLTRGALLTEIPTKLVYTEFYDVSSGYIRAKSQKSLYIPNFSFTTRTGSFPPDAYITVKTEGSPEYHQCFIRGYDTVEDVAASPKPIKKGTFGGQNIVVDLPEGITVADIRYVGVWCEAFSVEFGSISVTEADAKAAFNSKKLVDFVPPAIIEKGSVAETVVQMVKEEKSLNAVDKINGLRYGVSADNVRAVSPTSFVIENFSVTRSPPDAFIAVKTDGSDRYRKCTIRGYDISGSSSPKTIDANSFNGQDITVDLPRGLTIKDVRYVGVWCVAFSADLGSIPVSASDANAAYQAISS